MRFTEIPLEEIEHLLTERQYLVWKFYLEGCTQQEIARALYCSQPTVCREFGLIRRKLFVFAETRQEGFGRTHVTIAEGSQVRSVTDWTLKAAILRTRTRIFSKKRTKADSGLDAE